LQLLNEDFELDANKVVDYYHNCKNGIFEFGIIVDECKRCSSFFFKNFKVEFSRR